jgi:hypothetical protein
MSAYGTHLAEAFASKVLEAYFQEAVTDKITNTDYEGEIRNKSSKLHVLTFGNVAWRSYTGSGDITFDDPSESEALLLTDQAKYFGIKIQDYKTFLSWIKNPEGTLVGNAQKGLKELIDAHTLLKYADAGAGNWLGTNYTTGTVAVAATTGVVTGSGTTFTASMVGKPFKAAGHTKWYRVKTYTSATEIVIEDDCDDVTSAYTGGAISSTATYVVQADTALTVSSNTVTSTSTGIVEALGMMKTMLDKNKVPLTDRYFVGPADIINLLPLSTHVNQPIGPVYEEVVKRGFVGMNQSFNIYQNEQVSGNATDGYHCMFGIRGAITFAMGFTESQVCQLEKDFGKGYKGLSVWGSKVIDVRRPGLGHALLKI